MFAAFSRDCTEIGRLPFVEHIRCFDTIDSTNNFAKEHAPLPGGGITVVCAETQTAGRGQRENGFFSGGTGGLFCSIVCAMPAIYDHFTFNRALSLAICDALRGISPDAPISIKWPNDIYWGDRKVCGILLETIPSRPGYLVLGFGVNVNIPSGAFPADIADSATSVLIESSAEHDIAFLLGDILQRFWTAHRTSPAAAHARYTGLLYKTGARCEAGGREGVFAGVLPDGRMRLASDGRTILLSSGPVLFPDS